MARNGSGTYSVPNSFSANTTIESAKVNQNFSDVGSEITGSLPRNGEAGMTGQFKASDGTAAAPGMTFSSDPDTGFYRSSANVISMALAGSLVGPVTAFPTGTKLLFQQTAAPTGWTKDTTHNDKALRVVSGTASSGGTTAFSSVFAARTITEANLPNHTHSFSATTGGDTAHTHSFTYSGLVPQTLVLAALHRRSGQSSSQAETQGLYLQALESLTRTASAEQRERVLAQARPWTLTCSMLT